MSQTLSVDARPAVLLADHRSHLGESPFYDEIDDAIRWVDITAGVLHTWFAASATHTERFVGTDLAALVPSKSRCGLVAAVGSDLVWLDADHGTGKAEPFASLPTPDPTLRLNDCRADPWGRLWAGSLSRDRTPDAAGFYRLRPDATLEHMWAATISNGFGWSPDGRQMYYVDSTTQRIDVYDMDPTGDPIGRRTWVDIEPEHGMPDGIAIDAAGAVWVCLFGGGRVRRYLADGSLDVEIRLPVTNPTCPTLGGHERRTLYVTSARHRLSEAQLLGEPEAGAVLVIPVPVAGLPTHVFDDAGLR